MIVQEARAPRKFCADKLVIICAAICAECDISTGRTLCVVVQELRGSFVQVNW